MSDGIIRPLPGSPSLEDRPGFNPWAQFERRTPENRAKAEQRALQCAVIDEMNQGDSHSSPLVQVYQWAMAGYYYGCLIDGRVPDPAVVCGPQEG